MGAPLTVAPAPLTPFRDPRQARPPALSPLDPAEWVLIDAAYEPQMALRDRLVGAIPQEVALARPEAEQPLAELWALLAGHLETRFADQFLRQKGAIRRPDGVTVIETGGIGALGRLVQEDWCLLQMDADGAYRLTAAVVCFPSRWRLLDKIALPLTPIHDPVPDYADALAPRVDRIFTALRAEAPLERANWSLHRSPDLHQQIASPDAGDWWLRTERQTLRRLPETGAIVFGIKTAVTPLSALDAEDRRALETAIDALSPAERRYKGLASGSEALRTQKN